MTTPGITIEKTDEMRYTGRLVQWRVKVGDQIAYTENQTIGAVLDAHDAMREALEAVRDAIADQPSTMPQYDYAAAMDEYAARWARLKAKIDAAPAAEGKAP